MAIHARLSPLIGLFRAVQGACKASARAAQTRSTGLAALANEAGPAPTGQPLIGFTNEIAVGQDGWARVPYGEWPHAQGLQRFGRTEAEAMVGYFKNGWNRLKRAITGLPVFRGHPDHPAFAAQHTDRTVYGAVADMEARADALYLRPALSPAGAALVNEGLAFFSPHWLAKKLPDENGRPVFAPAFLVSIGLTDRPNIAGTSLVNAQPDPTTTMKLPEWLLALLGLANEATEDQVKSKVADLLARPEPTALANEQTALANEKSARAAVEATLAEVKTKLGAAETALANERTAAAALLTARNEGLVTAAIAAGRITEATKALWLTRLSRDFAGESAALANEAGALKTAPVTTGLGDRKAASNAGAEFNALVNERAAKGESWSVAWEAVKATPAGKALFEQMAGTTAAAK